MRRAALLVLLCAALLGCRQPPRPDGLTAEQLRATRAAYGCRDCP